MIVRSLILLFYRLFLAFRVRRFFFYYYYLTEKRRQGCAREQGRSGTTPYAHAARTAPDKIKAARIRIGFCLRR